MFLIGNTGLNLAGPPFGVMLNILQKFLHC